MSDCVDNHVHHLPDLLDEKKFSSRRLPKPIVRYQWLYSDVNSIVIHIRRLENINRHKQRNKGKRGQRGEPLGRKRIATHHQRSTQDRCEKHVASLSVAHVRHRPGYDLQFVRFDICERLQPKTCKRISLGLFRVLRPLFLAILLGLSGTLRLLAWCQSRLVREQLLQIKGIALKPPLKQSLFK